jgi:hypothetical protein
VFRPTVTRLRRLALLDVSVFDEAQYDTTATLPAIAVAAGSLLLLGLGGWLWWIVSGLADTASVFVKTVVLSAAFGLLLWAVWLLVVYAVLRRISGVTLDVEQLIRSAGLACAPLAAGVLMAIPTISFGVGLVALAGWVAATQVAIERTARRSGGDVVLANLLGFAAWAIGMSLLATGSNQIAPGPFLAESIWDAVTGYRVVLQ